MKAEREKKMMVIDTKGTTKEREDPREEQRGTETIEAESTKARKRSRRRTTSSRNTLESNKIAT